MTKPTIKKANLKTDTIGLADFYRNYNYPCYDVTSTTVPMWPYIPKTELKCGHLHSLNKKEWTAIIKSYFNHLKKYLMAGNRYELRENMGSWQMLKYKARMFFYYPDGNYGYKPMDRIIIKWRRSKKKFSLNHKTKSHWRLRIMPQFGSQMYKYFSGDIARVERINKMVSAKSSYKSK